MIQRDRIFSVSVLLPDKPGELARVAQTVADVQGNIIKLEHNQFVSTNRNAAVELRITMEAFGTDHKKKILDTLDKAGFRPKTDQCEAVLIGIKQPIEWCCKASPCLHIPNGIFNSNQTNPENKPQNL